MNLPAGITIQPTAMRDAWRVTDIRHLSGAENANKHHVYVNVLTADGSRDRNPSLRIGWSWLGRRQDETARPVALDKPDTGEQGHGNIPIQPKQVINLWIEGDGVSSDIVYGFRTDNPPPNEPGNAWGHVSYLVTFQRAATAVIVPVKPVEPDLNVGALYDAVAAIQAQLNELRAILNRWTGEG